MDKFKDILLASDLDGTLLSSDHSISDKNLEYIQYFQKNGGKFTVASGRPPMSALEMLSKISFDIPLVLLNGSIIFDMNKKIPTDITPVGKSSYEVLLNVIKFFPEVGCEIFDVNDIYMANSSNISKKHFTEIGKPTAVTCISDLPLSETWLKINFTNENAEILKNLEEFLLKNYKNQYNLCYSCKTFLEITNLDARKDISLFKLANKLGFEKKNIFTIGDNFNDYDMIKNAEWGFAPQNAEQAVKDVAFSVVSSCDNSAIADVIQYLDDIF